MNTALDASLIVGFYNQQPWAPLVLTSITNQAVDASFEVIVCDDGSGDDLHDTIRRFSAGAEIDIRYVWQPDRGFRLARSRNNAIRLARGRVLVFVDGDTWLTSNFLSTHLEAHSSDQTLACGLRYTLRTADEAALAVPSLELLEQLVEHTQHEHRAQRRWVRSSRPWMACLGGNFSISAAAGLLFDETFESWGSEDRDFAYRAYRCGIQPQLLPCTNAIHLAVSPVWDNLMTHENVVGFLNNKRYLAAKYPDGEMEPSLDLVKCCHLDGHTQRWSMGPRRATTSATQVLSEFEAWLADRSASDLPVLESH